MSHALGVAGLVAIATLAMAGCGDEVIDDGKAEVFVQDGLESQGGLKVDSVDCPSDVEVEKGKTFDCTAVTDEGRFTVTIRMTDDEGTVVPVGAKRAR
jgi:Domain of unknown function (DUF4333)